jgi:tagatose 1,6-diphosphate aldolase
VKNITALNETLAKGAQPWWNAYGGKENIEVIG